MRERLEQALRQGPCAVLCLDLDGFKKINDTLGHAMGDALLREVASRLRRQVRPGETLARQGGDEFAAVIIGEMPRSHGGRGADDRDDQRRFNQWQNGNTSTSIGIAVVPADGQTPEDLLRHADMALYRAKADGRGCYRAFESGMGVAMHARQSLEQDLRWRWKATSLRYIISPRSVERWPNHGFRGAAALAPPRHGMIPPDHFIPWRRKPA